MNAAAGRTYNEDLDASLLGNGHPSRDGRPGSEAPELGAADAELEELRRVRRALGKMNQGMENVQRQMKYFNSSVGQATQLLDIWVRVLSQATHNQAFLLNEEWQGGSMDTVRLNDLVQRDTRRQQEEERQAREIELRRERERELAEARERDRQRAELATAAAERVVHSICRR
ncbi:hypothetical protein LPJ61_001211 [Coemansia biformis]|uniref:DASH complex subunit DUO1 n=1 Tax=Coemansia biformis TaxID=1286918 RepID=A0A9W8D0A8_9FUNG|nr:hypothetical protein LPJ61_001211 [Coemansia biformis]